LSREKNFIQALKTRDGMAMASALTEMENLLWETRQGAFDDHVTGKARAGLKNAIAALAKAAAQGMQLETTAFIPLVESLVALRDRYRQGKQFPEADAVRDCLERANIHLIDGKDGSHWGMDV
jgi:cysteinyl-tRNA synthetase